MGFVHVIVSVFEVRAMSAQVAAAMTTSAGMRVRNAGRDAKKLMDSVRI